MYDEVVSSFEQDIEAVVGFAGSGKSTMLAKKCSNPRVLVLTPTHKAADVLRSKGITNVLTIHSVLKLVPTIDQNFRKGQKLQRLRRAGDVDMKDIKEIAIDEFSMIPTFILDILLAVLPSSAKVVLYGDPYQLPPVDGDAIDPLDYTDKVTELTTQHRAEAPEVVETFMRFMRYIKEGKEPDLTMNPKIKHGSIYGFNPTTDRALAYTNQKVLELNSSIAAFLELPREISVGEEILANVVSSIMGGLKEEPESLYIYPSCISKGKLMEGERLLEKIDQVEDDIMKFNTDITMYPVCHIEVNEQVYNIRYDLDHYHNSKLMKAEVEEAQFALIELHNLGADINLPEWCKANRTAAGVKRRGEAWKKYLAHQNLVFDLRRPFATTVHKAQGQEFETVYIAQSDIKRAIRKGNYYQYARLMYVALSRATKRVVLV